MCPLFPPPPRSNGPSQSTIKITLYRLITNGSFFKYIQDLINFKTKCKILCSNYNCGYNVYLIWLTYLYCTWCEILTSSMKIMNQNMSNIDSFFFNKKYIFYFHTFIVDIHSCVHAFVNNGYMYEVNFLLYVQVAVCDVSRSWKYGHASVNPPGGQAHLRDSDREKVVCQNLHPVMKFMSDINPISTIYKYYNYVRKYCCC